MLIIVSTVLASCASPAEQPTNTIETQIPILPPEQQPTYSISPQRKFQWLKFGTIGYTDEQLESAKQIIEPIIKSSPLCKTVELDNLSIVLYNNLRFQELLNSNEFFTDTIPTYGIADARGFYILTKNVKPKVLAEIFGSNFTLEDLPKELVFTRDYSQEPDNDTAKESTLQGNVVHEIHHICQVNNAIGHYLTLPPDSVIHEIPFKSIDVQSKSGNEIFQLKYGYTGLVGIYSPNRDKTWYFNEYEEITSYLSEVLTNVSMNSGTIDPSDISYDATMSIYNYMQEENKGWRYASYTITLYDNINRVLQAEGIPGLTMQEFFNFILSNNNGIEGLRTDLLLPRFKMLEGTPSLEEYLADQALVELFFEEP